MVDTPVAFISRELHGESKSFTGISTNNEYNIVYVLNNMYHPSMAELFLVMTCRYIHDYYVNDIWESLREKGPSVYYKKV